MTFEEFKQRLIALAKRKGEAFVARLPQEWKDEMTKAVQKALDTSDTMVVDEAAKAFARRIIRRD